MPKLDSDHVQRTVTRLIHMHKIHEVPPSMYVLKNVRGDGAPWEGVPTPKFLYFLSKISLGVGYPLPQTKNKHPQQFPISTLPIHYDTFTELCQWCNIPCDILCFFYLWSWVHNGFMFYSISDLKVWERVCRKFGFEPHSGGDHAGSWSRPLLSSSLPSPLVDSWGCLVRPTHLLQNNFDAIYRIQSNSLIKYTLMFNVLQNSASMQS